MKHCIRILLISLTTVMLCSCSNENLEPLEFFSELDRIMSSAAGTLDKITDEKSAHQASQKLVALSAELDAVVLRVKPIDKMSDGEAQYVISAFARGRSSRLMLAEAVNKTSKAGDHWVVVGASVARFGKSILNTTDVLSSYMEALPTPIAID